MGFFKKATKKGCKLRLALFGVSGGGKTYSALRLATGLGGKIALIDTEHGSASKYADRFEFDVCDCDKPTISNILMIVEQAKDFIKTYTFERLNEVAKMHFKTVNELH